MTRSWAVTPAPGELTLFWAQRVQHSGAHTHNADTYILKIRKNLNKMSIRVKSQGQRGWDSGPQVLEKEENVSGC